MTTWLRVLLTVLVAGVPTVASANRLSDTYREVFLNPPAFELTLLTYMTQDEQYLAKVDQCVRAADPVLRQLEQQLRSQHKACSDNAECSARAKEIMIVEQMRTKVRDLHRYLMAVKKKPVPDFLDSEIGQAAMTVYNVHRQLGIPLENNPVFRQEMAVLSTVACP